MELRWFSSISNKKKQFSRVLQLLRKSRQGKIKREEVLSQVENFINSPFWEVRNEAIKLTGLCGLKNYKDLLVGILLKEEEKPFLKRNSITALVRLKEKSPKIIDALLASLADPYWEIRSHAAEALGVLGDADERIEKAFSTALFGSSGNPSAENASFKPKEKNFEVRLKIAEALGRIGCTPNAFQLLTFLIKDSNWQVRKASLEGLFQMHRRGIIPPEKIISLLNTVDLSCEGIQPLFPLKESYGKVIEELRQSASSIKEK